MPHRSNFDEKLVASLKRVPVGNCFDIAYSHQSKSWGCEIGDLASPNVDYILFGDSHALSVQAIMDKVGRSEGKKIFFTGASGCIPFMGVFPNRNDQEVNDCYKLNERVFAFAKENRIKKVILVARWSYYTLGDYSFKGSQLISTSEEGPYTLEGSIEAFENGWKNTYSRYSSEGIELSVLSQAPHQKHEAETIYFRVARGYSTLEEESVSQKDFDELSEVSRSILSEPKAGVAFYDLREFFCDGKTCLIGNAGKSYYYDEDHLSGPGAIRIEPIIRSVVAE